MPKRRRKPRRTIHRRNPEPDPIVLQPRDDRILAAIYDYRALRRDQIQKLCFTGQSKQRVNEVLGRLFDHHYVLRRMPAREEGPGSSMPVYFLAKHAPPRVASAYGVDTASVHWYPHHNKIKWGKINHTLRVADTRIALTLAATQAGYTFTRSYNERTLRLKGYYQRARIPKLPKRNKVPDWYGTLDLAGTVTSQALEVDLSTESNPVFARKVKAYVAWVKSGAYQHTFDTTSLRVLTVTTSQRRLKNLKQTTEEAAGDYAHMFLFTHFALFLTKEKDILHDPIWQRAGESHCEPLVRQGRQQPAPSRAETGARQSEDQEDIYSIHQTAI